jgi:acyl-CoA thioesterase
MTKYSLNTMPSKFKIPNKKILDHILKDPFGDLLNTKRSVPSEGESIVELTITEEHVNCHGVTHGGVIFSCCDMALALASNSRGQIEVATQVNISFLKATGPGTKIRAHCKEIHEGKKLGLFEIIVTDFSGEVISRAQGQVYKKKQSFNQ